MFSIRWVQIIIVFLIVAGLFTAGFLGYLNFIKNVLLYITQPVIKLIYQTTLSVKEFFISIATIKDQINQRHVLEAQVKRLDVENASLLLERDENAHLRQMLGLKQNLKSNSIAAAVVLRDPTGITSSVAIDKGTADSVSPEDAVLDEYGNLLGIIKEVDKHSSKFLLVTDGMVKIDANVAGKDALGVVSGSHGLGLSLDLVSQNIKLEKGDRVITSGLTGKLPGGILIGTVGEHQSSGSELFQKVSVNPAAKTRDFKFVLIVTGFEQ